MKKEPVVLFAKEFYLAILYVCYLSLENLARNCFSKEQLAEIADWRPIPCFVLICHDQEVVLLLCWAVAGERNIEAHEGRHEYESTTKGGN